MNAVDVVERPELSQPIEQQHECSITFLNMSGDITLTWDTQNREAILELVRKKMAEGYSFLTLKKLPLLEAYRKVKVTERNLNSLESLTISDTEFEKMVENMDDRDIATLLQESKAILTKRKSDAQKRGARESEYSVGALARKAEDVLNSQSVAIRPVRGG